MTTATQDVFNEAASNGGSRPVPDPTELTDKAIARAIAALTDYIDGQLAVRDERLNGIDTATSLRLDALPAISREIDSKIGRVEDLHDEKFASIQTQFSERDTRSERESRDNKVAVDAAFAAQKEAAAKQDEANAKAIDKSEKATAETIKTNQELNAAKTDALTKALDEVKFEVRGISATKVGAIENRTQSNEQRSGQVAMIGLIIGIIVGVPSIAAIVVALASP